MQTAEDAAGRGIFETNEEQQQFLDYTYAARRAELA